METIDTIIKRDFDLSIFEQYQINCAKCCGLCCVALYFNKSDGFPKDKAAGVACGNLQVDYKCKMYASLSHHGLKGCMAYDCFGAGQFMTSRLKTPPNWHMLPPDEAVKIFNTYLVVMRVHQTLWYLSQCLTMRLPQCEKAQAQFLLNQGNSLIDTSFENLSSLDPEAFCKKSNELIQRVCGLYQTNFESTSKMPTKNYMGKNMQGKNLAKKDFSMSLLIAANLEQALLYEANFLGADMRDTNICNTDLSQSLFLTQIQINSARGNCNTILPPYLYTPKAWGCK